MKRKATIEFYRDRSKKWRWRLIASNGRKLASSGESFANKTVCVRSFETLAKAFARARVIFTR